MTEGLRLKAGETYLNVEGQEIDIVSEGRHRDTFLDLGGDVFDISGKLLSGDQDACRNLITKVTLPTLIIEVGKTYEDKEGEIVTIADKRPIPKTPFFFYVGDNYCFYAEDGRGMPVTLNDRMTGKPYPLLHEYIQVVEEAPKPSVTSSILNMVTRIKRFFS